MAAYGRDCMSLSASQEHVDTTQLLVYMQVTVKEISNHVKSLMSRMDDTSQNLNNVERVVAKIHQHQIVTKMERGPSLGEFDDMMKRNMSRESSDLPQGQQLTPRTMTAKTTEILRTVEVGFGQVLDRMGSARSSSALLTSSEMKDGAAKEEKFYRKMLTEVRSELESFRSALLTDFRADQERVLNDFQHKVNQDFRAERIGKVHAEENHADVKMPFSGILAQEVPPASLDRLSSDANGREWTGSPGDAPALQPGGNARPMGDGQYLEPGVPTEALMYGFSSDHFEEAMGAPKVAPIASTLPDHTVEHQGHDDDDRGELDVDAPDIIEVDVEAVEEEELDHNLVTLKEGESMASVFMSDDDVVAPPYHVEEHYKTKGISQKIARSNFFANFTVGVVALNAVYIGVDSDWNNAQNIYDAAWPFQACSQFFCVYFTWELVVRYIAFAKKRDCLRDGWFKFDTFLVITMIADTWVIMPIMFAIGGRMRIPTQPLRMLRLFKLTRMARLMKAFPELVTMIKGLLRSLRAISSSMILIGLMVYVWAIMMHMLMKDEVKFNEESWTEMKLSFSTLTKCIWTLLTAGTLMLDNASPLMNALVFSDKINFILAGLAFMMYALLSALLILQMLIGVLCDVVARVGSEQREANAVGLVKQELLSNLKKYDTGGDGRISQEELLTVMCNERSKAVLRKLNINRAFVLEMQKLMFRHSGESVPIKAVLQVMIMCQGNNLSTVESMSGGILAVIHEISTLRRTLEKDLRKVQQGEQVNVGNAQSLSQQAFFN